MAVKAYFDDMLTANHATAIYRKFIYPSLVYFCKNKVWGRYMHEHLREYK